MDIITNTNGFFNSQAAKPAKIQQNNRVSNSHAGHAGQSAEIRQNNKVSPRSQDSRTDVVSANETTEDADKIPGNEKDPKSFMEALTKKITQAIKKANTKPEEDDAQEEIAILLNNFLSKLQELVMKIQEAEVAVGQGPMKADETFSALVSQLLLDVDNAVKLPEDIKLKTLKPVTGEKLLPVQVKTMEDIMPVQVKTMEDIMSVQVKTMEDIMSVQVKTEEENNLKIEPAAKGVPTKIDLAALKQELSKFVNENKEKLKGKIPEKFLGFIKELQVGKETLPVKAEMTAGVLPIIDFAKEQVLSKNKLEPIINTKLDPNVVVNDAVKATAGKPHEMKPEDIVVSKIHIADLLKHIEGKILEKREKQTMFIKLDPPNLGEIKVSVSMQGEKVSVSFNVNNAFVKNLITENMSELMNNLNRQGLNAGSFDVSQFNDPNHQENSARNGNSGRSYMGDTQDQSDSSQVIQYVNMSNRLVDIWA